MFSIARTDFLSFISGFLNNIRDEYVILITIFFIVFIVLLLPPAEIYGKLVIGVVLKQAQLHH